MEIGAQDDIFAASASTSSKRHLADDDELEDSPDTKILKKSTVTRLDPLTLTRRRILHPFRLVENIFFGRKENHTPSTF